MVANPNNFWVSIIIRDRDYKVVRKEFRRVKEKLAWIEKQLGADTDAE
jgi:hypothetical protein